MFQETLQSPRAFTLFQCFKGLPDAQYFEGLCKAQRCKGLCTYINTHKRATGTSRVLARQIVSDFI